MPVDLNPAVVNQAAKQIDNQKVGWIPDQPAAPANGGSTTTAATQPEFHLVPGGDWLAAAADKIPAIWGTGDEVLWASGESLFIVGPAGVGKTTLTGQLVRARIIDQPLGVIAWPVIPGQHRTLYLACDRPRQIARSLARQLSDIDPAILNDRLIIQNGPPPGDLAKDPGMLLRMCEAANADTVVIDSLKDVAIGLSDDDVGGGINQAIQRTVAAGVEVLVLHHQRKSQAGTKPKHLEDVYGSTWITAGAGSVLLLWGQAGDPVVDLFHLKQPAEVVGPHKIEHDHGRGVTVMAEGNFDLVDWITKSAGWVTAADVAKAQHNTSKPTAGQVSSIRRILKRHADAGTLEVETGIGGGAGGSTPSRYRVPTGAML